MKNIILICFLNIIIFNSCKDDENLIHEIKIVNNSSHNIYQYGSDKYSDTTILNNITSCGDDILPHQIGYANSKFGWEDEISSNKFGIYMLFFVDGDTTNKYPSPIWENEYKILKRYDLTLDYLKKNNWTITYCKIHI